MNDNQPSQNTNIVRLASSLSEEEHLAEAKKGATEMLDTAKESNLVDVVVVGVTDDNTICLFTSMSEVPNILYLLVRAGMILMNTESED